MEKITKQETHKEEIERKRIERKELRQKLKTKKLNKPKTEIYVLSDNLSYSTVLEKIEGVKRTKLEKMAAIYSDIDNKELLQSEKKLAKKLNESYISGGSWAIKRIKSVIDNAQNMGLNHQEILTSILAFIAENSIYYSNENRSSW